MKLLSLYSTLLFALALGGCGPSFGPYLVPDNVKSSEQRMAILLQNKEAYSSQDEWVQAINYTTHKYSSTWWEGYSALDNAMKVRDLRVAEYLLKQGADPNGKPPMKFIDGEDLEYPIQRAVIKSRSDDEAANWAQLLLKFGADPNLASRSHAPALQQAIIRHYPKTVDLLLNHSANTRMVTSVDPPGISDFVRSKSKPLPRWYGALNTAVRHANDSSEADRLIIKTLLEYGADFFDMSIPYSPSLAEYARQQGKPQLAEYSVQAYADIRGLDARGLAKLRQKINSYDLRVGKDKSADEKKKEKMRLAERNGRQQQMVDESNTWATGGISLIEETVNQYHLAEGRKLPNVEVDSRSKLKPFHDNSDEDNGSGYIPDCNADGIDDRKQERTWNVCIE